VNRLETLLDYFARSLHQYRETGTDQALNSALSAAERLVGDPAFASASACAQARVLAQAGSVLLDAHARSGSAAYLERAVSFYERTVSAAAQDCPGRPAYLSGLGNA
jgi:hypothetical protein